ncbi:glycoside hydrolase family 18 protein [Photobacterium carnosum]|uniref:glycoside hydrolase family 18 protein n=1 Tax=Photobacterium carnosum TaxID=2023717 RepID=UPI001E41020F|nr:glycoside hydrolase family 18 protein [Photobacterium carnosum]MCD9555973.1 glycoside hydrolase family 18 protein [Photobacterium carnosum]
MIPFLATIRPFYVSLLLACSLLFQINIAHAAEHKRPYVVAAYYPDWKIYTPNNPYSASMIPAEKLTHLIYAFLAVCGPVDSSPDNIKKIIKTQCKDKPIGTAIILDEYAALQIKLTGETATNVSYKGNFGQLKLLSEKHPHLNILPSFGGWTLSEPFHTVAVNPVYRQTFINTAVDLITKYDFFDGIQIDWEYPGGHGLSGKGQNQVIQERQAYSLLIEGLRHKLDDLGRQHNRQYQLSAAINADTKTLPGINWAQVTNHLDQLYLMSFDFLGNWDNVVGHHSNLYSTPNTPNNNSVDNLIKTLIGKKVDPHKIIIGSSFYGRGWQGVDLISPDKLENLQSQGGLKKGSDIKDPGYFTYSDISKYFINNPKLGYRYFYDQHAEAAVLYNQKNKEYISFEDKRSLKAKADYAKKHKLGGVFGWEITSDTNNELITILDNNLNP